MLFHPKIVTYCWMLLLATTTTPVITSNHSTMCLASFSGPTQLSVWKRVQVYRSCIGRAATMCYWSLKLWLLSNIPTNVLVKSFHSYLVNIWYHCDITLVTIVDYLYFSTDCQHTWYTSFIICLTHANVFRQWGSLAAAHSLEKAVHS